MSDLPTTSITHTFNGDTRAAGFVDNAQLDTQLGNLAANQNLQKAVIDRITNGNDNIAAQSVGQAQLKPEVVVALDDWSLAVIQKTLLPTCACVATANIALTGLQTLDGHLNISGERVLVTAQATASQNGIYTAAVGAWTKVTNFAYPAVVSIDSGTLYASSTWTVDSTLLVWTRVTPSYVAGLAAHIASTGTAVHGLGNAATKAVGTVAGTVAAGDDARLTNARAPTAHASTHVSGASDPLVGNLDAAARINTLKNSVAVTSRRGLNLIEGANVTLTVTEDIPNERTNVTFAVPLSSSNYDMLAAATFPEVVKVGSSALVSADQGKWLVMADGTAQTLTLPAASAVASGATFAVTCRSSSANPFPSIVTCAGGDTMYGQTFRSSVTLLTGNYIILQSNGVNSWYMRAFNFDTDWFDTGNVVFIADSGGTIPTWDGGGALNRFKWRRVGPNMEVDIAFTQAGAGAAGTGGYIISRPSNIVLDNQHETVFTIAAGSTVLAMTGYLKNAGFISDGAANSGILGMVPCTGGFYFVGLFNVASYQKWDSTHWPLSAVVRMRAQASFRVSGW